jgi:hypothetical protein
MLAKSQRYYWDQDAVREPLCADSLDMIAKSENGQRASGRCKFAPDRGDNDTNISTAGKGARGSRGAAMNPLGRNIRDVWTIATQPFPGAHFAVMPPKLVEPCIKAGCPEGGTVLDPFAGAGTVGLVADRLRRKFIGIELNPEYAQMAEERIMDDCPLFAK